MEKFVFQNATKIIFGKDTETLVGEEVKSFSNNILLVHTGDEFLESSGILDRVTTSLRTAGVEYIELSDVKPNPQLSKVREGIEICRKNNLDFVLAVGGGSSIDTAKAIAAGVSFKGDVWDLFLKKEACEDALPTGSIVTIAAAGSESSNGAVITNEETNYKLDVIGPCLRPKFAILNPELTLTLPQYQTICGATDIMSHVMERYFTNVKNVDLTDRLCEAVIKTVIRNTRILMSDPQNIEARAEIMWASTIAHGDLLSTGRIGDWASHDIGMEISAIYDSAHGATLSVITPAWMEYVYKENIARFAQFATRIWGEEYDPDFPELTALQGIKNLKNFFIDIGMPVSLGELGVGEENLEIMAAKATERRDLGNLKKLGKHDVLEILKLAL